MLLLLLLLLLHSLLFPLVVRPQSVCDTTTYINTHRGNVSVHETLSRWGDASLIREWETGHNHHELVTVQLSGAPCGGVLSNWTLQLRAHSTDFAVFQQVILEHEFEFVHGLFEEGPPPKAIIDLGGNAGLATLFLATRFPSARVVLVEPMITNFLTAQTNTFQLENVFLEHGAIWGHVGHIEISGNNIWGAPLRDGKDDWAVTVKEVPKTDGRPVRNIIPGITIPYLMQKYDFHTVDFLKIDVEGAEVSLFAAENKPQFWLERVRCFSIEIHAWSPSFPADWTEKLFMPLVISMGFSNLRKKGELSIWCKTATPGGGGGG